VLERALAPVTFDITDSRGAAAVMLAAGAILPFLPGHAGLPCPLRTLTGVPCPMCGMTTSVEATLHGHPGSALGANPAGPALVLCAVAILVRRPKRLLHAPVGLVIFLFAAMWLFELNRFHVI
jgi:Protein of unknown function (DUF2752)